MASMYRRRRSRRAPAGTLVLASSAEIHSGLRRAGRHSPGLLDQLVLTGLALRVSLLRSLLDSLTSFSLFCATCSRHRTTV